MQVKKVEMDVVQDAYSLRCSPQIHGPIYEAVWELQRALGSLCNKAQSKWVEIGGKRVRNLAVRSERESMMLARVVCALNEMGHASFLRCERMLNT